MVRATEKFRKGLQRGDFTLCYVRKADPQTYIIYYMCVCDYPCVCVCVCVCVYVTFPDNLHLAGGKLGEWI